MDNLTVICPGFGEIVSQNGKGPGAAGYRGYEHPIDGKIIKTLDTPVMRSVFRSITSMSADAGYGQMISSGIPVDEDNFPEINTLVDECISALGIRRPYVVITSSMTMNAFTVGNDEEAFIVLGSMLVRVMSPKQLKFVIGHECGHIAMGHLMWHTAATMAAQLTGSFFGLGAVFAEAVMLALNAWSRRSEITADRAGFLCIDDADVAKRALIQLETGFIDSSMINIDSYINNSTRYRKGGLLRKVGEYKANHPLIAKRIEAINAFASSEVYLRVTGKPYSMGCIREKDLNKRIEKLIAVV
ncbi:MAG: M48 family metallopeptidase [Ruminiclostridium sp.]|nr:M48 family metallopeptidase [Ruminiclostridium sp.]